jgi:transcriptional activator of cad operon
MKYQFDDFSLDTELFSLTKASVELQMEPRIFQLLAYFCEHANRPVSREELIDEVWGKRIVSTAAINRAVSELRKIIEPDNANPSYLKTISKIGYSFTATVNLESSAVPDEAKLLPQTGGDDSPKTRILYWNNHYTRAAMVAGLFLFLAMLGYSKLFSSPADILQPRIVLKPELRASPRGVSFKAQLSPYHDAFLFINRQAQDASAQIWYQEGQGQPRAVTAGEHYYLNAIFVAKNQIYASRFNNLDDRDCEIVSIDLETGDTEPLFQCSPRSIPMLAYNDALAHLYFNHRQDINEPYSIYQYQIKTGRLQQLTRPPHKGNASGDYLLSLSHDKQTLAILEYRPDSHSSLKLLRLATQESHYSPVRFTRASSLAWLNNRHLVTVTDEGLQFYDTQTNHVQTLLASADIGYVAVDNSTQTLVYDKYQRIGNLYRYDIDENRLTQETPITTADLNPFSTSYASRSQSLAFFTYQDGSIQLKLASDSSLQTIKFIEPITSFGNLDWSKDNRYLIAGINNGLHRYDMRQAQWQDLVPNFSHVHFVHYANANTLLFSTEHSGDWQIWSLDLNKIKLKQITEHGGYSAQGNPDSGVIYLTKFNQAGLFKLDLTSGKETLLIADAKISSWGQWQLSGDHIYLATSEGIDVYDTQGQRLRTLKTSSATGYSIFSVSDDESQLVMPKLDHESSEIWRASINWELDD